MKCICVTAVLVASMSIAFADSPTEQAQRALKEQGFYYGDITGQLDVDTTAAIRRYQIRNGLKVTGELDSDTRKSLGVSGPAAETKTRPAPTAAPQPSMAPTTPDTSDLRDDSTTRVQPQPRVAPPYAQAPTQLQPDLSSLFAGTRYEMAPPEVQQRVIVGAQTLLSRGGYYRSDIDGVFGPETAAALRAYQARVGLEPTGRPDDETLGALGLLPGQNSRGFPHEHRLFRRPPALEVAPNGEPIYVPR